MEKNREEGHKGRQRKKISFFILLVLICTVAVIFLVPVVLTVLRSFYMGEKVSLVGYRELFLNCFPFYRMFWNSVLYAVTITAGAVLIAVPAAFAFCFAKFPGKHLVYVLYIVLMMMPLQVMILPNYIGLRDLGLLNTRAAVILPLIFSPLGVVVLRQYMDGTEIEAIEAARLETSSCLRILWHCVLPQLKVCICAVALFLFAESWNLLEQPLLYLNEDSKRNLSIFFSQTEKYEGEVLYPAAVLFMVPVCLWYLLYHRELKEGLKYH